MIWSQFFEALYDQLIIVSHSFNVIDTRLILIGKREDERNLRFREDSE
jgi:hypothetical protein